MATTGENGRLTIRTANPVPVLTALTSWALDHGGELAGLEVRRPSLEEIYLELVEEAS